MPTPRRLLTLCLACASVLPSSAVPQTLARPGWVGSGITTDLWWKHAVVYQVNPANFDPNNGSSLHGVTQHLDYIRSLGTDALLLTPIQPDLTHAQTIDPTLGTLDDLDDLIHEASRRNMRVLLDLNPASGSTAASPASTSQVPLTSHARKPLPSAKPPAATSVNASSSPMSIPRYRPICAKELTKRQTHNPRSFF
jgi:hypothetical protein